MVIYAGDSIPCDLNFPGGGELNVAYGDRRQGWSRYAQCGNPGGHGTKRVAKSERVITLVGAVSLGNAEQGVGRAWDARAVETPLILQGLGASYAGAQSNTRASVASLVVGLGENERGPETALDEPGGAIGVALLSVHQAKGANISICGELHVGECPSTGDPCSTAQVYPIDAVGGAMEENPIHFGRTAAAPEPGNRRTIEGQGLGSGLGVINSAEVLGLMSVQIRKAPPTSIFPSAWRAMDSTELLPKTLLGLRKKPRSSEPSAFKRKMPLVFKALAISIFPFAWTDIPGRNASVTAGKPTGDLVRFFYCHCMYGIVYTYHDAAQILCSRSPPDLPPKSPKALARYQRLSG